jgi:hypothetical protein
MKRFWLVVTCAACLLVSPRDGLPHGMRCTRIADAVGIRAEYDDGRPVAAGAVTVYAPHSPDQPLITGTTDSHGRFFFVADTGGTWQVTVRDNMGHQASASVSVGGNTTPEPQSLTPFGRLGGIVIGMSILFGLFGLFALFRRSRPAASSSAVGRDD